MTKISLLFICLSHVYIIRWAALYFANIFFIIHQLITLLRFLFVNEHHEIYDIPQ